MSILEGSRIVLAVTGGIAAYKAADLASKLVQAGARVDVVLTRAAEEFVRPLTFSALTRRPVQTDLYAPWTEAAAGHVTLAHEADLIVVAPATANAIARLSLGLADDMLGAINLATGAPMLVAPAMEEHMYLHPATQAHLSELRERGVTVVGPETGRLASGESGLGRLVPTEQIRGAIRVVLGRGGALAGRRLVITAGGTQEPLDPVRYLGNRSSGQMGYALAGAALERGAGVTLVTGPTHLDPPFGARVVPVGSALEMRDAVDEAVHDADALVMAAAVADFRPAVAAAGKIKKQPGVERWEVSLVRNPDIVAGIDRPGLIKVGFAAETEDLIANAAAKLAAKGLAMIVANEAVATIGSRDSTAVILRPGLDPEPLPTLTKTELAELIVDRLAGLLHDGGPSSAA
jgi:phosphopantothenoylcysteine decarboxylase/phosphopantothenate--cysteine ligase